MDAAGASWYFSSSRTFTAVGSFTDDAWKAAFAADSF
jgi:hypothetical protein